MVDFVVRVNNQEMVLCEVKSPSVMRHAGDLLPEEGFESMGDLTEYHVMRNMLNQVNIESPVACSVLMRLMEVAQCLGIRELEWLFITSHNHWIVCRLVRHDQHPFLAYSPTISIEDSSEPFRAFLGAILSVLKDVPVEPSIFSPNLEFDPIEEKEIPGPLLEDDIGDQSGSHRGSSTPQTHSHSRKSNESGLMVRSFSLAVILLTRQSRLLRPHPTIPNPHNYGYIYMHHRIISLTLCRVGGIANDACG
jgi:hypothetical protein